VATCVLHYFRSEAASRLDLRQIPDEYQERAECILETLQSYFVDMPRGESFLEGSDFRDSFERFRQATSNGADLSADTILAAIKDDSRVWVVLRAIAGVTPPEAAALTMEAAVDEGDLLSITTEVARRVDARCRRGEPVLLEGDDAGNKAARTDSDALSVMATYLPPMVARGPGEVAEGRVHRFDKVDTRNGLESIRKALVSGGEMYAELLYERILGRPFATHRDAVSDLVGDALEYQIMGMLAASGIEARQIRRREIVETFEQAPDIIAPYYGAISDVEVVIEAKLAEDDGTARDKVARVKTLRENEDKRASRGETPRQIVAVLDGRGFGVRAPDLRRLLDACDGHVYTAAELEALVQPRGPFFELISES
jgi:hypothetical protein